MFTAKQKARIDSLEAKFDSICKKIEAVEDKMTELREADKEHTSRYGRLEDQLIDLENDQCETQEKIEAIYESAGVAY